MHGFDLSLQVGMDSFGMIVQAFGEQAVILMGVTVDGQQWQIICPDASLSIGFIAPILPGETL